MTNRRAQTLRVLQEVDESQRDSTKAATLLPLFSARAYRWPLSFDSMAAAKYMINSCRVCVNECFFMKSNFRLLSGFLL
jgi:hypothetical protein